MHKRFEKQLLSQPKEVVFCKKCVMSNQRPRITFDEEGICGGCRNTEYFKNGIDWQTREKELIDLLDKYRSSDGSYDVLVPSTGGKDSAYVAHELKFKYGMNPLTVTWSPLMYTDIGWKNFQSLRDAGLSNYLISPNGKLHRNLSRLCLEELGDAFHIFVLGQVCLPFRIALQTNIKLVMFGENGEAEYAGDPATLDKSMIPTEEFDRLYFKGSNIDELVEFAKNEKKYFDKGFCSSDIDLYKIPDINLLIKNGIVGKHFYSYYRKWIPQQNFYYASENTGFTPNDDRSEGTYSKYASLDDKADGFHYYLKYIKFGFGRTTDDASHEIRDGHISREEGMALVKKYDGEFPKKYYQEFKSYLGINDDEFNEIVDSFRSDIIWKKENNKWELRHKVWEI